MTFKISGYYLETLTTETMQFLGRAERKIKR